MMTNDHMCGHKTNGQYCKNGHNCHYGIFCNGVKEDGQPNTKPNLAVELGSLGSKPHGQVVGLWPMVCPVKEEISVSVYKLGAVETPSGGSSTIVERLTSTSTTCSQDSTSTETVLPPTATVPQHIGHHGSRDGPDRAK